MRLLLCSMALLCGMGLSTVVVAVPAASREAGSALVDESAIDAHVRRVAKQLRCLVCQGESVADSHAELARDMRRKIREKLQQGWNDQRIFDYFVARYGDFVRYRPPLKASTWLLWFGPLLLLMVGLMVLFAYVRHRSRQTAVAQLSAQDAERARALLDAARVCCTFARQPRCCPKFCQTRRVAPVVAFLRPSRATPAGGILGATLRAGAIFPQSCVAVRYGRMTSVRSLRLVLRKNGLRRGGVRKCNRP